MLTKHITHKRTKYHYSYSSQIYTVIQKAITIISHYAEYYAYMTDYILGQNNCKVYEK